MEIGPRDMAKGEVVLVRRDTGERVTVGRGEVEEGVRDLLERIHQTLFER